MRRINIINTKLSDYESIEEYLIHTYGQKKLDESTKNSKPTFLDVVGYTLDKYGYETTEGKYYELRQIERNFFKKEERRD